jgi:hypothetical protein
VKHRYTLAALALILTIGCNTPQKVTVATAVPALEALLKELTLNSSITVVNPIPADLTLEEHHQFLDNHQPMLDSLAARVAAVVTIRSALPDELLFLELRSHNIRAIEIDCATPLSVEVTGVALLRDSGDVNPYVWLSISNVMKMAEIAGNDLSRLSPADSVKILANLKKIKQRYFALKSDFETKFSLIDNFSAASMDPAYDYLLNDINLFVTHRFPADESDWTAPQISAFKRALSNHTVGTLVCSWKPTGEPGALTEQYAMRPAILRKGDIALQNYQQGLYGLLEQNLASLLAAYQPSGR